MMKVSTAYLHLHTDGHNHCRFVDEWTLQRVSMPCPLAKEERSSRCRVVELSTAGDERLRFSSALCSTELSASEEPGRGSTRLALAEYEYHRPLRSTSSRGGEERGREKC